MALHPDDSLFSDIDQIDCHRIGIYNQMGFCINDYNPGLQGFQYPARTVFAFSQSLLGPLPISDVLNHPPEFVCPAICSLNFSFGANAALISFRRNKAQFQIIAFSLLNGTLYRLLKKYDLDPADFRAGSDQPETMGARGGRTLATRSAAGSP